MRFVLTAFFILAALPAFAAPLKVVASFSILGDMVKQVGGDLVAVETLVGPDGDAHVFQPTPADGKKIAQASIVFINGLGFEGWMERLIKSTDYKGTIITVSDGLKQTLSLEEGKDEHNDAHSNEHKHLHNTMTDPHAWQDLTNGRLYIQNIAKALANADSANAKVYNENAKKRDKEMSELDAWIKKEVDKIPAEKRKVITSHDAFGYFANAYGISFMAPVGMSTEAEPSAKDMKELIEQIKSSRIKAIFIENMANPKIIKQLADEAGASVGSKLYADALSPASGVAATYQAMFKYNVEKLLDVIR